MGYPAFCPGVPEKKEKQNKEKRKEKIFDVH